MRVDKWFYRGGRPNRMARMLNRCWAAVYAIGVAPNYLVTLEVLGRRSGRIIRLPLVMVVVEGERYICRFRAMRRWPRSSRWRPSSLYSGS